eukprot:CAMPEP_0195101848 /NCGR_PEP_ID=MMETSP0448-20130528/65360_1 /TAXON_ID=66468 /ORGANISM="Heterocapsa triquestra, Strain CCMP 448" /LENGTH=116 /DNA_ID=CAMNT_0040137235 /DNA_START=24 /DNA_END=372 /DNA_ORIENTATION=+
MACECGVAHGLECSATLAHEPSSPSKTTTSLDPALCRVIGDVPISTLHALPCVLERMPAPPWLATCDVAQAMLQMAMHFMLTLNLDEAAGFYPAVAQAGPGGRFGIFVAAPHGNCG